MKNRAIIFIIITSISLNVVFHRASYAYSRATESQVEQLKIDLATGRLVIGAVLIDDIRKNYGDPPTITHERDSATLDYKEVALTFTKSKLLVDWSLGSYTASATEGKGELLREDLQNRKIKKGYVLLDKIVSTYGEPTRRVQEDPDTMTLYYGDTKLIFDELSVLSSWRAEDVASSTGGSGVLSAAPEKRQQKRESE